MPTTFEILEGLASIVRDFGIAAIIWHIIFAFVVVLIIAGWRPSRKFAATALAVPLLSVSVFAWIKSNFFNGLLFFLFAALLAIIGLRLPDEKVKGSPAWSTIVGILLVTFGWIYPHFLAPGSWLEYLYAAPTGLIPCPTLSIIIGFALLANGFSSRSWSITLVIIGVFYGLFGAIRLNVHIDFVLLAGALILLVQTLSTMPPASSRE